MTLPALQQPIALTHQPATAQNTQFGAATPGTAGEQSAIEVHDVPRNDGRPGRMSTRMAVT